MRAQTFRIGANALSAACAILWAGAVHAFGARPTEDFLPEPMPPGFHVEASELEGPVFADSTGRTLYKWPLKELRNGYTGDTKGNPTCDDTRFRESAGLMSPYPPGLVLPDLDTRPTCAQMWPPVIAPKSAKAVGKWTLLTRKDGARQWAYDGYALYACKFDRLPGDVMCGSTHEILFDAPAVRQPVGPAPNVPPGFTVSVTPRGRLLQNGKHFSVYASDADAPGVSNCVAACAQTWAPILAPQAAQARGDWSVIERSAGIKQWAFRKRLLYTYALDRVSRSQEGSDVPGWHNIYTQPAPAAPDGFTVQDTTAGQVLADPRGMTIYLYRCGDDAPDQLLCDHPDTTQAYRLAMCGGGDADRCLRNFPLVPASKDARSLSRSWSIIWIDPKTGRGTDAGVSGAERVWAFRDRPVYTYAGDSKPGDINADAHGEFRSEREGFIAFWLRDDFFDRSH